MTGRKLNIGKTERLYGNHLKIPEFTKPHRQLSTMEVNEDVFRMLH